MGKVRSDSGPFKNYRQLAWQLTREGRLALPRPERCGVCRQNCGFVKDGHYFRDFVFRHTVVSHVGVQRYGCKGPEGGTFGALAGFQEPRAHYTVQVRGAVLDRVFIKGRSQSAVLKDLRRFRGSASLARSTVWEWCRRFRRQAGGHAAALTAHLAQHLPTPHGSIRGDPELFLRAARAAFGLYPQWASERFWEWLHDLLFRAAGRRLLSA
jgi:hypothetical protein